MLDVNIGAVITQALAFIILVFLMAKFAFKPIGNMLDERQRGIQETLDQVAADRRAMEQTRADYEQRLANIEAEAREHISGAVKQAQVEASAILEKARAEATEFRERAVADIDQERRKAVVEIRAQMADLAVVAASKVLEREITPGVHRDLISDFIGEVGTRA
jgi:F-type H+-transporting ATPase subunit b